MKTKILGILAVAIALAASAFTTPKASTGHTNYKWFNITDGIAVDATAPQADASYFGDGTMPPSGGQSCSGSANQCVSGFLPSQVNGSDQLINNSQAPAQQPST